MSKPITDTSGMAWMLVVISAFILMLLVTDHFDAFWSAIHGKPTGPSKHKNSKKATRDKKK